MDLINSKIKGKTGVGGRVLLLMFLTGWLLSLPLAQSFAQPNIVGTYKGSGTLIQFDCIDESDAGTFAVSATIRVSRQVAEFFFGSAVATTDIGGISVDKSLTNFDGIVTLDGRLQGFFTYTTFVDGVSDSSGDGTFIGQVTGNTLEVQNFHGKDQFGDTCEFDGTLSATRADFLSFTFTPLDVPGSLFTAARGTNDAGQIVGTSQDFDFPYGTHGFLFDGTTFTPLDVPGADFTRAVGINNAGQIVGTSEVIEEPSNRFHGFLFDGTTFTPLDFPGADFTEARGINDAGQIVGRFGGSSGVHGFVFDGTTFTPLDFPGARFTEARGINNAGQIVGTFEDASGVHGFVFDGTTFTPLDFPGALFTEARGINNAGQIVGTFEDASGIHGFVFDGTTFTPLDFPGALLTEANGINNAGQIVGEFLDPTSRNLGFLATPAP